jgi:hypothetical protein
MIFTKNISIYRYYFLSLQGSGQWDSFLNSIRPPDGVTNYILNALSGSMIYKLFKI